MQGAKQGKSKQLEIVEWFHLVVVVVVVCVVEFLDQMLRVQRATAPRRQHTALHHHAHLLLELSHGHSLPILQPHTQAQRQQRAADRRRCQTQRRQADHRERRRRRTTLLHGAGRLAARPGRVSVQRVRARQAGQHGVEEFCDQLVSSFANFSN